MWKKITTIFLIILIISFMHISATGEEMGLHLLHRELFFLPILLGCFWFGLTGGLTTATIISLIYGPMLFFHAGNHGMSTLLIAQIGFYFCIAALAGWLSDSRTKKEAELRKRQESASIGRAAAALSFEIKEVAMSMKKSIQSLPDSTTTTKTLHLELDRLEKLFQTLSKYHSRHDELSLATKLTTFVNQAMVAVKAHAAEKNISIHSPQDSQGCSTTAWTEGMGETLVGLIKNAIEASPNSAVLTISIHKEESNCQIDVINQGKIPEDVEKNLFRPFFTTKKDGHGLSLAAGRKVLRDHGGDLLYCQDGENTRFRMIIPQDSIRHTLEELVEAKSALDG